MTTNFKPACLFSNLFSDIEYLRQTLPEGTENEFFDYLANLTAKDVTLYAIDEGTVAFPRVPIIKVEGPLIIVQLLETTLLTLVNYARFVLLETLLNFAKCSSK